VVFFVANESKKWKRNGYQLIYCYGKKVLPNGLKGIMADRSRGGLKCLAI